MKETKRCIKCLKPATKWSGYVTTNNGVQILAGWCSHECLFSGIMKTSGCCGRYKKEMGMQED